MFPRKKISTIISVLYVIFTFYNIFFHYFTFVPVITTIRKSSYGEEIYFSNEMGGYIWHPEDESVDSYKNVLFYFNDMEGNGSARFNIMRRIQQEFPDHTIIQMDYPGFGLSYNMSLSLKSIEKECSFVLREVLTSNIVEKYSCWGEGLGNWVMAMCLKNYTDYDPYTIIHYNICCSPYQNMNDKFSHLAILFILSYVQTKNIKYYYKSRFVDKFPNIKFLYNDSKNSKKNSIDSYYDLDFIPFPKKEVICLSGKGTSAILIKENYLKIKNIMI